MMSEFSSHLEYYSKKGMGWFSVLTSEEEWGNIPVAKSYLEKFWLSNREYETKWIDCFNRVFIKKQVVDPCEVFNQNFSIISIRGGSFFVQNDFEKLQKSLFEIGEEEIILIENTFDGKVEEPAFRMKFPVSITWRELTSGNFISSTILEDINKEYYLFGSNTFWGAYVATNDENPVNVIGIDQKYNRYFMNRFEIS